MLTYLKTAQIKTPSPIWEELALNVSDTLADGPDDAGPVITFARLAELIHNNHFSRELNRFLLKVSIRLAMDNFQGNINFRK